MVASFWLTNRNDGKADIMEDVVGPSALIISHFDLFKWRPRLLDAASKNFKSEVKLQGCHLGSYHQDK